MNDEFTARQRAISLRLTGRSVKQIRSALGRGETWFHKWWRRYLEAGPDGLYDLTRANHHVAQHISPELERTILSIRRRLQAHASPATRYSLIGATAILAELKTLGVRPLPCERTIERILQRNGLTAPRVRLAPLLPRQEYPGPQARASNQLHEVDLVGPIYLQGSGHRYYIWVGKDAFDGAVCLRLAVFPPHGRSPLVPRGVLEGPGYSRAGPARQRTRAGRLGAGGAYPVAGDPALPALRRRPGVHPGRRAAVQRRCGELQRLVPRATVPTAVQAAGRPAAGAGTAAGGGQHPARPPAAGGQTPAQHRRGLRLRKLPASFVVPTGRLPLAEGRVTFIRRVSVAGTVTVLSQSFRVGKRHRGLYLRLVVDTGRGWLTAYLNGRVLKRWPYKLLNN